MTAKNVSTKSVRKTGKLRSAGVVGRVTHTNVDSSEVTVVLLAANQNRLGASITNDATGDLYVKLAAGAAADSYAVKLGTGDYFELPAPVYPGIITGIWSAAAEGDVARVAETT